MPSSMAASVEQCKNPLIDMICQSLQVVQPAPGVGTSGQIKKIRLENFMCHDNLLIEFTYVRGCFTDTMHCSTCVTLFVEILSV
jgi:hypothetical protein